ncbi:hypothetical protein KEM52_005390, partial [Ascosphaera acerosa]
HPPRRRRPATGFEHILRAFGLDHLGPGVASSGVHVDERGQLHVDSVGEAQQKHATALLVSRAPRSLTERDFVGLLSKGEFLPGWRSRGGLDAVIPWRYADSLRRDNRWILLFRAPADATRYQQRAVALRAFVRANTPPAPASAPARPLDYEAPAVPGFTLGDYTIGPPFQAPAIYAFLHPFPAQIQAQIKTYRTFMSYSTGGSSDGSAVFDETEQEAVPKYAVRVWMDDKSPFLLNHYLIRDWLLADGLDRHVPWLLAEIDHPIQPLGDDPAGGDMLTSLGTLGGPLGAGGNTHQRQDSEYLRCHNWLVFFRSAGEARRFVRTFHRTPLPKIRGAPSVEPMPLIKTELLVENQL